MNSRKTFNKIEKNSRFFLRISQISALAILVLGLSCKEAKKENEENIVSVTTNSGPWSDMEKVVNSVKTPEFPDKTFSVLDYGAKADGGKIRSHAEPKVRMGRARIQCDPNSGNARLGD